MFMVFQWVLERNESWMMYRGDKKILKPKNTAILKYYLIYIYTHTYIMQKSPPAAAAKSLQSCSTLCDPIDSSLPGSPVLGILQARTLEWVAISFSKKSPKWDQISKLELVSQMALFFHTAAYELLYFNKSFKYLTQLCMSVLSDCRDDSFY